jgi:hypothetical protein
MAGPAGTNPAEGIANNLIADLLEMIRPTRQMLNEPTSE